MIEGVTPTRVFAQVINSNSDLSALTEINLTREPGSTEVWSATVPQTQVGSLATIVIYAAYPDDGLDKLSEPLFLQIGERNTEGWMLR